MKHLLIIATSISILFSSCDTDHYGGYDIEGGHAMTRTLNLDKEPDTICTDFTGFKRKGCIIKFHTNDGDTHLFCATKGSNLIDTYVDSLGFDSIFMVLSQKPLDKICECNSKCLEKMHLNNNHTYLLCLAALGKSTFHQYWIIRKASNDIYGPLSKEEYIQKREELGVPKNLIISMDTK